MEKRLLNYSNIIDNDVKNALFLIQKVELLNVISFCTHQKIKRIFEKQT